MSLGHSPGISNYTMTDGDKDAPILQTYSEKHLGAFLTVELKFHRPISNIIHKANAITGIVKRSFECPDSYMLRSLYTSLICPHLDYESVIWDHYQLGDIHLL